MKELDSLKAISLAAGFAVFLLSSVAIFNYSIDPMCHYRCDEVELRRATSNFYYQAAQKVLAHPDASQIILASSRGGTTSPPFVEKISGLKTLNLEVPGAEVFTKVALLNFALEKSKIKRVIWFADYFEMIPDNLDEKLKGSFALRRLLGSQLESSQVLRATNPLITLIDQNTTAASIHTLKMKPLELARERGGNSGEYLPCDQGSYDGKVSANALMKKVDLLYENYTQKVLRPLPSELAWVEFESAMKRLDNQGVEVAVVIIPYHPRFMERLRAEFPAIYDRQAIWVERVKALASTRIRVLNYLSGIPGGDSSPKYWNDGVHFTCNGALAMLKPLSRP